MARQSTTPLQASAQRFLTRRMIHALVRRDVAMQDDSLRGQSLALVAGGVLGAMIVAVCAVVALIRPQGVPESAPIVMARESGALYVRIGDVLHPVPNLASARLVARSPANPFAAGEALIARTKRGPLVGIPGAPATIGAPVGEQDWMVCDAERTVVTVGDTVPGRPDASRAALVTPRGEAAANTYLLYDGRRAKVDLRDLAVVRALRLDAVVPVPVSRTLLDLLPEVPAIAAPSIAGAGDIGPASLGGVRVGAVVRVLRADVTEHFVVLADGAQSIDEVTADLIRFTHDSNPGPVPTVAPAAIAATPVATTLEVETFPRHGGTPVGVGDGLAVCASWHPGGPAQSSNTVVRTMDSGQFDARNAGSLAQDDGKGPNVDAVRLPAGRSAYVRSARIVGDDGSLGARFLVDDAGVVFGVHDDDAAKALGLGDAPGVAPWPILAHLPRGPELGFDAASVLRDGFPAPS
jgi:type VII secretion protein EccB